MTTSEIISRLDRKIRPLMVHFSPEFVIWLYSGARKIFLSKLSSEKPHPYIAPEYEQRVLWDIKFSNGLFNAAGMFKNGEGYYTVAAQGAGAYLAGTTTSLFRRGNQRKGILHPFLSYPRSHAASNWMGLPNYGHEEIAKVLSKIEKVEGCPVGASLSIEPEIEVDSALKELSYGLELYEKASVDFIELNESCPNIPQHSGDLDDCGLDTGLIRRLEFISEKFLKKRKKDIPVIVKFSVDTKAEQMPLLLDLLIDLKYDGINLGNTSTDYQECEKEIAPEETKHFRYFVETFEGGVSGKPIKSKSLELASFGAAYLREMPPSHEFHVIRTGGIENLSDIRESEKAGIALNQWFTGYFENFSLYGHKLYKKLFESEY